MEISSLYRIFRDYPIITTDSRNIPLNSIFFALKGDNFNGNSFASEALAKGAAYAVIDEAEFDTNEQTILVDNVLLTLQQLAQYHRNQLGVPILAITGTNGKTTTKELISAVLSKKFKVNSTKGNLNNHIGVPLTLLSMDKQTEFGVVEIGAQSPGRNQTLCDIANPDFGLVTNIGKHIWKALAHLKE